MGIRDWSTKEKSKLQESHQEKVRMKKKITFSVVGGYQLIYNQFRPVKQKLCKTSAHACRVRAILIRMILKWKRANITETINERK